MSFSNDMTGYESFALSPLAASSIEFHVYCALLRPVPGRHSFANSACTTLEDPNWNTRAKARCSIPRTVKTLGCQKHRTSLLSRLLRR